MKKSALLFGGIAASSKLNPLLGVNAFAAEAPKKRFIHLFLTGGWDSALATDPVIGSKSTSVDYEAEYKSKASEAVPGKSNIVLGEGLLGLKSSLQNVPVAVVNGMYVEVTGHDLATSYLLSGRFSLSRQANNPALAALLAAQSNNFPSHCILGADIPLGNTAETHPPIAAIGFSGVKNSLRQPLSGYMSDESFSLTERRAAELQNLRYGSESKSSSIRSWSNSVNSIKNLYARKIGQKIDLPAEELSRYGASQETDIGGQLAAIFQLMKADATPYYTVLNGDYDTHNTGLASQTSQLQSTSTALSVLLSDLASTPDPISDGSSLLDNTTILISSEFVRTPKFNRFGGTDHWQSASAILIGSGVKDNVLIGRTGDDAMPLGWSSGAAVARTDANTLRPEHIAAAVMAHFGQSQSDSGIYAEAVDGLFI